MAKKFPDFPTQEAKLAYDQLLDKMLAMAESKMRYVDIAKRLNDAGLFTRFGKPWTRNTITHALIDIGFRRVIQKGGYTKREFTRKEKRGKGYRTPVADFPQAEPKQAPATPSSRQALLGERWEVLRGIENMRGISSAARKCLMDLVWKEVNK